MNTPRRIKRFGQEDARGRWTGSSRTGTAALGIHNDEAAIIFAQIVSEFSFLETAIEYVFGRIVGVDNAAPKLILRQVQSPSMKIKLMQAVLERTPHNREAPELYNEIIDEFSFINDRRNQYVHGKWETCEETEKLYLTRPRDDPYGYDTLISEEFDLEEMRETRSRALELWNRIYREVGAESPIAHIPDPTA